MSNIIHTIISGGDNASFLFDAVHDINSASFEESGLRAILDSVARRINADCWSLSVVEIDRAGAMIKDGYHNINTYPEEWVKTYEENKFFECDPIVYKAFFSEAPCKFQYWKDTFMGIDPKNKRAMDFMEEAFKYESMKEGCSVSHSSLRKNMEMSLLSFGGHGIAYSDDTETTLFTLAEPIHNFYVRIINSKPIKNITETQKQILKYISNGVGIETVSEIMKLSVNEISKETDKLLESLQASTLAQAVCVGLSKGVIGF